MKYTTYDSRKPFKSADFGQVKRDIGVLVSIPFRHMGIIPGRPRCVEVSYETPRMFNTETYAALAVPEHHWRPEAIAQTETIIGNIDKLIADLNSHRSRLKVAVGRLRDIENMKQRMIYQAIQENLT